MKAWPILGGLLAAVCLSSTASAQSSVASFAPTWNWQPRAATAGESYARGAADLVRSAGAANLLNSEAAKNWEDARSKNFDNRIKYTKTFFEKRRLNREYREAERGPRPTSEQLFRISKNKLPERMTPSELDPVTGKIEWPSILRQSLFDQQRQQVDQLFAYRASHQTDLSPGFFPEARSAVSKLRAELTKNVRSFPPQQFGNATTFLRRLTYELQF